MELAQRKSLTKKIKRNISLKKVKNKNAIDPPAQARRKTVIIEKGEDQHPPMKSKTVVAAIGQIVSIEGDIAHGQDLVQAVKETIAVTNDLTAIRQPNLTTIVGRLCCKMLKGKVWSEVTKMAKAM